MCLEGVESVEVIVNGIYKHFKGNKYKVLMLAKHSETEEDCVVYQALYGERGVWVRPLAMFLEKVDRNKYPNVIQEYRFEYIGMEEEAAAVIKAEDLEDATLTLCENAEKYIWLEMACQRLSLHVEEYNDNDNYEVDVELNKEETEKLLLQLRKDLGSEKSLGEIVKGICQEGSYYPFIRYCDKFGIRYSISSF